MSVGSEGISLRCVQRNLFCVTLGKVHSFPRRHIEETIINCWRTSSLLKKKSVSLPHWEQRLYPRCLSQVPVWATGSIWGMDPHHVTPCASPDVVVMSSLSLQTVGSHRQGLALVLAAQPCGSALDIVGAGPVGGYLGEGRQLQ